MKQETRWLVSPAYDLTFFIGSVSVSFAFYGAFLFLQSYTLLDSVTAVLLVRALFFHGLDQSHIFQTGARVYGDKEQFEKVRGLATWGIFAISILMIARLLLN